MCSLHGIAHEIRLCSAALVWIVAADISPGQSSHQESLRKLSMACKCRSRWRPAETGLLQCEAYAGGMAAQLAAHAVQLGSFEAQQPLLYLINAILFAGCGPSVLASVDV